MTLKIAMVMALSILSACASFSLRPSPDKLQPWTTALRDRQPDGPFNAVYRAGERHLVFIGAQHENRDDSATFRMIRDAYTSFEFDIVIAEGFPTSWGANPTRILDMGSKSQTAADGFVEGGETIPTVFGAQRQKARLLGGEPDDAEIKHLVARDGITDADLIGFYVLRNVPQWISERAIKDVTDPGLQPLVEKALVRQRDVLQMPPTIVPDYSAWLAWYETTNRKRLSAGFDTEEVGPLADGRFGTNKIAYAVSKARDVHLHRLVVEYLNARKNVLVVFGGSHLMIHRAALDAILGKPCYEGSNVSKAVVTCR